METKTIGKFISALRKANGMTQRELAEKLFVSDKTISRWECDESAPDLSLIPLIADIFGITADELLRGERNNASRSESYAEDAENRRKAKSDKHFRIMLDKEERRFKNLSLISVGITALGIIIAMIAHLGFSKGLLAFCLALAFCVASEISEICFTINARILNDEEYTYNETIDRANTQRIFGAVGITFINIITLAFCLPLVTLIDGANYGLVFEFWIGYGILFSLLALVISYVIYSLFIRTNMCKKGIIILSDDAVSKLQSNNALLKKLLIIFSAVASVIIIGIITVNSIGVQGFTKELVFDNCEDFKAFVESDYDKWYKDGYSYYEGTTHVTVTPVFPDSEKEDNEEQPNKEYEVIRNANNEVICEYYYNRELYKEITFTESSYDKMPVTVITYEAFYNGKDIHGSLLAMLYVLIAIDFIAVAYVYIRKLFKGN